MEVDLKEQTLVYWNMSARLCFFVPETKRDRFVDDLSVLEIINLLTVGLVSFNWKQNILFHISEHNVFIPAES